MSNQQTENLDERIERIKKRNEELEKKYKEAEEDKLMALKENAMISIKPPKDFDDWPREHKYDKLDFTYDQKEIIDDEDEKEVKVIEKLNFSGKPNRDYKFPDGSGPPPDPSYSFLADAERDGNLQNNSKNIEAKLIDKKDWKQTNSGNNQRGRGGQRGGRGRQRGNDRDQRYHHKPHTEYDAWKNERTKIDEERISRQKSSDGKWRREWDNDKLNSEQNKEKLEQAAALGEAFNALGLKTITTAPTAVATSTNQISPKSPTFINNQTNREVTSDSHIQSRGNILVSVSQNGEVKSVKLTANPTFGTGRVASSRQTSKPQFSIQKEIINNGNGKPYQNNHFERKIINSPQKTHGKIDFNNKNKSTINYPVPDTSVKVNINDRLKRNNNINNNNNTHYTENIKNDIQQPTNCQ